MFFACLSVFLARFCASSHVFVCHHASLCVLARCTCLCPILYDTHVSSVGLHAFLVRVFSCFYISCISSRALHAFVYPRLTHLCRYVSQRHTLHLPSELISSRTLSPTGKFLANMEAKLRFAQATRALSGLRRSLAIRAELSKSKDTQVRGQHANTCAKILFAFAFHVLHVH